MAIAGIKISSLRTLTSAENDDYLIINDESSQTTKKITITDLFSDVDDITVNNTVTFGSLKDAIENITVTKFVDAADGVASNDNDTTIPTTAAVKAYVDGVVSDRRAKSNIKPFAGALDKLANLAVYEFNIASSLDREIGVIADELQEQIPYLVNGDKDALYENGNPQYQTVSYSKMVPILLAAIQELQNEIEQLKSQNKRG